MLSQGPNGMTPPGASIRDARFRIGAETSSLHRHNRMLSQGPKGMRPLELLAEMPGEGLEPNSHHYSSPP